MIASYTDKDCSNYIVLDVVRFAIVILYTIKSTVYYYDEHLSYNDTSADQQY